MTGLRIGFAGLTHLGIVSAAAAAIRGFDVVGFDVDSNLVDGLRRGRLPFLEPDLDSAIEEHGANLEFTCEVDALLTSDLIYVAPDVPTDDDGEMELTPVRTLIDLLAPKLERGTALVVLSQVEPGFSRSLGLPADVLYYQVETLVFGQAIARATNPERFIVGCAEPDKPLPQAFKTYLEAFDCPILPMRYESAELAKIAINCCLVGSVSIANTLAELCETMGARWSEIVPALRLDRRIGPYAYIEAGLGIAGGNLERDLATVLRLGAAAGSDTGVIRACLANSRYRKQWALIQLHEAVLHKSGAPSLGVLGIAYKKDTSSIKNSPSIALMEALDGYAITAYDPAAALPAHLGDRVAIAGNALEACDGKDAVAIMTPWDIFADQRPAEMAHRMSGRVLLDPYGVLDRTACLAAGLDYRSLGMTAEE